MPVLFAMARDGLLPRQAGQTGSHGTRCASPCWSRCWLPPRLGVSIEQARRNGQRRHLVPRSCWFPPASSCCDAAVGLAARIPRAMVPLLPIASVCACGLADGQPDRRHLGSVGVWMVAGIAIYLG